MYVPTYYIIVSFVETEKLQHFCDVWSIDLGGRRGVLGHLGTFVKVFSAQIGKSYKNCGSCITMS